MGLRHMLGLRAVPISPGWGGGEGTELLKTAPLGRAIFAFTPTDNGTLVEGAITGGGGGEVMGGRREAALPVAGFPISLRSRGRAQCLGPEQSVLPEVGARTELSLLFVCAYALGVYRFRAACLELPINRFRDAVFKMNVHQPGTGSLCIF